jgi:hypothetical protein
VLRVFLAAILLVSPVFAGWTEYRIGPFHVISDAGNRAARQRLNELEQVRHVLGGLLGKTDLETVWPIDLVLFPNQREYGAHALPAPFVDGGSATLAAWTADTPLPHDLLRQLTLRLIEDNAGRMPDTVETALGDLFSTIQVKGTLVTLGAPPAAGELPPDRRRAWAKLQMLATQTDYSGTLRVFLNNLQQGGDEAVAARNAFNLTAAELEARVDAYLKAGNFTGTLANAEALDPNRDFVEVQVPQSAIDALLAELKSAGKDFPPESPRGLLAKGTRPALELAAKANPRWAEPYEKLAALETDPAAKVKDLATAAKLAPRNVAYWQALAEAQAANEQYAEADKSWAKAVLAAPNEAERARLRKTQLELKQQRAAFELAEQKRKEAEAAAELERIKAASAAEVHAAEEAANLRQGGLKPGDKPVPWFGDPAGTKLSGTLTRVDCLAGPLRLTIRPASGAPVRLAIRDTNNLQVKGAGEAKFPCGIQRPARKINVIYSGNLDPKLGTSGDVSMVEFP